MFIVCPKCSAKYQIPDGIILENGQKLKCSACECVFLKGEESPLNLGDMATPITDRPAAASSASIPEPFSTPLYAPPATTAGSDTVPEVFQPVENRPKSRRLWLIPLYMILIVLMCLVAWFYRDSITPTVGGRRSAIQSTIRSVTDRPIRHTPTRVPTRRVRVEEIKQTPDSVLKQKSDPIRPIKTESVREVEPTPTVPVPADLTTEPDETPLVEAVLPTVSSGDLQTGLSNEESRTATPFIAGIVTFRSEPTAEGTSQLLIEGQLRNVSANNQRGPEVTIRVLAADGRILNEKKIRTTAENVPAGQTIPFYTGITPAPENVDHIDVVF